VGSVGANYINYIEAEDAFEQERFCYENKDIEKRGKGEQILA
jgi:hypothetical protein